jgi:hypothetical protein
MVPAMTVRDEMIAAAPRHGMIDLARSDAGTRREEVPGPDAIPVRRARPAADGPRTAVPARPAATTVGAPRTPAVGAPVPGAIVGRHATRRVAVARAGRPAAIRAVAPTGAARRARDTRASGTTVAVGRVWAPDGPATARAMRAAATTTGRSGTARPVAVVMTGPPGGAVPTTAPAAAIADRLGTAGPTPGPVRRAVRGARTVVRLDLGVRIAPTTAAAATAAAPRAAGTRGATAHGATPRGAPEVPAGPTAGESARPAPAAPLRGTGHVPTSVPATAVRAARARVVAGVPGAIGRPAARARRTAAPEPTDRTAPSAGSEWTARTVRLALIGATAPTAPSAGTGPSGRNAPIGPSAVPDPTARTDLTARTGPSGPSGRSGPAPTAVRAIGGPVGPPLPARTAGSGAASTGPPATGTPVGEPTARPRTAATTPHGSAGHAPRATGAATPGRRRTDAPPVADRPLPETGVRRRVTGARPRPAIGVRRRPVGPTVRVSRRRRAPRSSPSRS